MAPQKKVNQYRIEGDTAILLLTLQQETTINLEDIERVLSYKWTAYYDPKGNNYRVISKRTVGGRQRTIYLARLIMNAPQGYDVDHIDNNTLNNCRSNLRIVTKKQNQENRSGSTTRSKTGVRNVTAHAYNNTYIVQVKSNWKTYYGGSFPQTPQGLIEAEQVAIELRRKLFTHSKECVS